MKKITVLYVFLLSIYFILISTVAKENGANKSIKSTIDIVIDNLRFTTCVNQTLATLIDTENSTFSATWSKPKETVRDRPITSIIDIVIENVRIEEWEDDTACASQILANLLSAKNSTLSATWVLDSIQTPSGVLYGSKYQLGNYDECMNAFWVDSHPQLKTKYCLADVKLTDDVPRKQEGGFDPFGNVENYVNTLSKHGRPLNTITWGVCVPSSCTKHGVSTFLKVLFRSSVLSSITPDPVVTVDDCQTAGEKAEVGTGAVIFLWLVSTLFVTAVLSTWYLKSAVDKASVSLATKLARCFCMNKNAYDLVKPSTEDIPVLHGMRAMTAILFVYAHQIFFLNSGAVGNGLDLDKFIDNGFFLMHTDLMTDTFLMMSGLLLARSLSGKHTLENPVMVLWKRYIRLIGPMALVVFYLVSVSVHMGNGPIWQRLAGLERDMCSKTWWLSLLMLNNYIRSEEMCFITLWYVPADYQLTMLGVFLIYLCKSHPRRGQLAVATAAVLSVLLPAYATYTRQLPGTIMYDVATMLDIRQNEVFNSTYIRSHYRIGSYIMGLCVGYIMSVYKPALHRNLISKKTSIIMFVIFFIVAWVPWVIGGLLYTRKYDAAEAAIFAGSHRIVWVLVMGLLVLVSEYGNLPIVIGLLSWSAWVPLSRLSYGLYLVHPLIIQYNVFSTRTPLRHHPFTMLSDSFGPVVIGYLLSFLVWLLVQAPINNLINLVHFRRKELQQKEETGARSCVDKDK